jgi:hypothetical protein
MKKEEDKSVNLLQASFISGLFNSEDFHFGQDKNKIKVNGKACNQVVPRQE